MNVIELVLKQGYVLNIYRGITTTCTRNFRISLWGNPTMNF